jgi:hypothetical protein
MRFQGSGGTWVDDGPSNPVDSVFNREAANLPQSLLWQKGADLEGRGVGGMRAENGTADEHR